MSQKKLNASFQSACSRGDLKAVKKYLDEGAEIDSNLSVGFLYAIDNNHIDVLKYLISRNVDIYIKDNDNLKIAFNYKNKQIINLLIEADHGKKWNCYECIVKTMCNKLCRNYKK